VSDPIARIEEALAGLGAEHEPPRGWEARVLAATAPPKQRRWWVFAAPAVALAAVAVFVLRWPREPGFELAITFDRDSVVVRGDVSPHVGDVAHATAIGGGPNCAVWIYRDDALVMACPGGAKCRSSSTSTSADVTLTIGTYWIVALRASSPIAMPAGKIDLDLARAQDEGATLARKHLTVH